MTITKNEFNILNQAAAKAADIFPELTAICTNIENRSKEQNKKNSAYIMEKRKSNKNYCR